MAAFLLAAVLPISFASCGDDDDDNGGGGNIVDPGGTVIVNIRNANNGEYNFPETYATLSGIYTHTEDGNDGSDQLKIDGADNLYLEGGKIVCVGKVSGLGAIKTIPQNGWTDKAVVMPGYGYVVKGRETLWAGGKSHPCTPHYARIYVVDYMTNTSGGVIGATIQYQCPWGG